VQNKPEDSSVLHMPIYQTSLPDDLVSVVIWQDGRMQYAPTLDQYNLKDIIEYITYSRQ
jgi:hypothetical protein